ncbi:MAG: response regulator [Crocinitomicaceae bacterium]|nr:response regulator [Crocinitomicaceae bacterium]
MKTEIKIFIVGGHGVLGEFMMNSLKERFMDVSYFRNEAEFLELLDQKPNIVIIDDSRSYSRPIDILKSVRKHKSVHVIYVSKNTHFINILKVIKYGAIDFVRKDSCTNYAVNKSIDRIFKLTDNFKEKVSSKEFFESSGIQKRYPLCFRLSRFMMF